MSGLSGKEHLIDYQCLPGQTRSTRYIWIDSTPGSLISLSRCFTISHKAVAFRDSYLKEGIYQNSN